MHLYVIPTQSFLSCQICGGLLFARREVKMTTTGMTFFDLDWLNKSAEGAICVRCGFVHTFMGPGTQWVDPAVVNPADLPADPLAGKAGTWPPPGQQPQHDVELPRPE